MQAVRLASRRFNSTNNMTLLKKLRETSGCSIVDCKTALSDNAWDMDKAKAWLMERSKAVQAKVSNRSAKEGLVGIALNEQAAVLACVRCETDFVARGEDFQGLVRRTTAAELQGKSLPADEFTQVTGKLRENVLLEGVLRLLAPTEVASAVFGSYLHNRLGEGVGTAAAIVQIATASGKPFASKEEQERAAIVARMVSIQAVGGKPKYLSRDEMDQKERHEEEAKILAAAGEAIANKPEKVKQGIIKGKMEKYFGETCLLDQTFVSGEFENKLVKDALGKDLVVRQFARMSLDGQLVMSKLK